MGFAGVGSTGVAALELDRRFIGIEVDKEYFEASCTRLNQKHKQLQNISNL